MPALVGVGEVDDDPVVGPDRIRLEPSSARIFAPNREPPGGMHASAERREDAETPVADLVAEALDDQCLIGGHDAGRGLLLAQVGDEVLGGEPIEVVLAGELLALLATASRENSPIARPSSAGRPTPRRARTDRPGDPGRGDDDDAVAGDLLDPP